MFKNVKIDEFREFADQLVAGCDAVTAADIAGIDLKPFGNQRNCYVYALANPVTGLVFYVGKGSGKRAKTHGSPSSRNALKNEIIADLRRRALKPTIHVLADGLSDDDAYRLERAIIVRAHSVLTNINYGQQPEIDRVRAMARINLGQIKPLCAVLRERPDKFRLSAWQDIVSTLARMSVSGTA